MESEGTIDCGLEPISPRRVAVTEIGRSRFASFYEAVLASLVLRAMWAFAVFVPEAITPGSQSLSFLISLSDPSQPNVRSVQLVLKLINLAFKIKIYQVVVDLRKPADRRIPMPTHHEP